LHYFGYKPLVAKSPGNLESWYKRFVFLTLEGLINVIVRPDVYQAYRGVLRGAPLIVVEGRMFSRVGSWPYIF